MTKIVDTHAHISAAIAQLEAQIKDAKENSVPDVVPIYLGHIADLRDALTKVRMLSFENAALVSMVLRKMETTRHQTRSRPMAHLLNDGYALYTVGMSERGEINIACGAMQTSEKHSSIRAFAAAYPAASNYSFESAMRNCGILMGSLSFKETDDGKIVYLNEHIQWMYEQWHSAR